MALFEWETRHLKEEDWSVFEKGVISLLSIFGYSVIVYSCYSYFIEAE
ncbi:MAG: hypothetical protein IE884_07770 [Sulfuricurvum sp.]|nr:hypothetical protein [Sulfuricurvum sp.]